MPLKLSVEGASPLTQGVWSARLTPDELRIIGQARSSGRGISILMLPTVVAPLESEGRLEFDPAAAQLLHLGQRPEALIVFGDAFVEGGQPEFTEQTHAPFSSDDQQFLEESKALPKELAAAGAELLRTLRTEFPGGYLRRTPSGRYVNRPTNFWAIKVQPRDRSYSVIVRGYRREYAVPGGLDVRDDQRSYSRFKLSSSADLPSALAILRRAGKR